MKSTFIICVMLMVYYQSFAQKYLARHDTLLQKYVVEYESMGTSEQSYERVGNKKIYEKYYFTKDSLIEGNFFFSVGLCVSNIDEPYYFVRISYLEICDNDFYSFNKPVRLSIELRHDEYSFDYSVKKIENISLKKTELGSIEYMGLNLKSNCNIFKLKSTDVADLFKYRMGSIKISSLSQEISMGGNGYFLSDLIADIKNNISVSLL